MNVTTYGKMLIASLYLSTHAVAGIINFNDNLTLGDLLNTQNPSITGEFDISSILNDYQNSDVTILDAALNLYGYSTVNSFTSTRYSQYIQTGSVNRRISQGRWVNQGFYETYQCGAFGTCTRYIDTSYYLDTSYNVFDRTLLRDATTNIEDLVQDEVMLNLGGQSFFSSAKDKNISHYSNGRSHDRRSGSHSSGFSNYYTNTHINTEQYFGEMKLELDIKSILAEELLSDSFILEWGATASRGHFNLSSVSLDISYNKEQRNATSQVPEPGTIFLLASGIGIAILKRKNGLLISENN